MPAVQSQPWCSSNLSLSSFSSLRKQNVAKPCWLVIFVDLVFCQVDQRIEWAHRELDKHKPLQGKWWKWEALGMRIPEEEEEEECWLDTAPLSPLETKAEVSSSLGSCPPFLDKDWLTAEGCQHLPPSTTCRDRQLTVQSGSWSVCFNKAWLPPQPVISGEPLWCKWDDVACCRRQYLVNKGLLTLNHVKRHSFLYSRYRVWN